MSSLGVTMDHCLSNTLTIESLSRNVEVKAAFAEYSGFSIPTGGPGYEISDVKRLPADTLPDTEIRAGGDVTFTVRPAAEYSDFSKLTVNGYDCLTGSGQRSRLRDGFRTEERGRELYRHTHRRDWQYQRGHRRAQAGHRRADRAAGAGESS